MFILRKQDFRKTGNYTPSDQAWILICLGESAYLRKWNHYDARITWTSARPSLATSDFGAAIGSVMDTVVPDPAEDTFIFPLRCLTRSRIPRMPTPDRPSLIANSLWSEMPFPWSWISRVTCSPVRMTRISAVLLSA